MSLADYTTGLESLEQELLTPVWPTGRNPRAPWDGRHFALPRHLLRPISVSFIEARVLANLVALLDCRVVLEIGTGFGYSTAWLARGLSVCSEPSTVYTVDDQSQGNLQGEGLQVAHKIWGRLGLAHLITPLLGRSPRVPAEEPQLSVDLAFIDGDHYGEQPLLDYRAVAGHLRPEGVVVFHDVQPRYDVDLAVAAGRDDGLLCVDLGTSCEMVVAARSHEQLAVAVMALALARRGLLVESEQQ